MPKNRIQSVLFNKEKFTLPQAVKELLKLGFNYKKYDETDEYHRFRQVNPNPKMEKRIINIGKPSKGIRAIYEFNPHN